MSFPEVGPSCCPRHTHTHTFSVCVYVVEPSIGAGVSPSKVTHLPEVSYFCCFLSPPAFFLKNTFCSITNVSLFTCCLRTFSLYFFLSACHEVSFLLSSPFTCQKEIWHFGKSAKSDLKCSSVHSNDEIKSYETLFTLFYFGTDMVSEAQLFKAASSANPVQQWIHCRGPAMRKSNLFH